MTPNNKGGAGAQNSPMINSTQKRHNTNENFIGVPPNLTESSHKTGEGGDFVDEEEEEEA